MRTLLFVIVVGAFSSVGCATKPAVKYQGVESEPSPIVSHDKEGEQSVDDRAPEGEIDLGIEGGGSSGVVVDSAMSPEEEEEATKEEEEEEEGDGASAEEGEEAEESDEGEE